MTNSQEVLNQLILDHLLERKRKRIWRWVLRALFMVIVLWTFYGAFMSHRADIAARVGPHVGIIDIKGPIMDKQAANAENFSESLEHAYTNKGMKALVFRIDSPGGSPVQADYMYNAVRHYKEKNPDIKTYAVCVDMCASAAYYVAAAADEIYAAPSSMVGSIGVIYNGFGFVDTLQKLGATRRMQTAGTHKGFLDSFSPEKPEDVAYLQRMLDLVHQQFIEKVKTGRGERLKVDDETFSGLFWTGIQAKERGLIDGFGSSESLARDVIKEEHFVDYTTKENVMELLAKNLGAEVANGIPAAFGLKPGIQ
ncbi:MAG: S49 family peptidase [Gammaproteobacteria bacterium]|nr:S49 family peptidase [Gammaproteobacteria bacterium]